MSQHSLQKRPEILHGTDDSTGTARANVSNQWLRLPGENALGYQSLYLASIATVRSSMKHMFGPVDWRIEFHLSSIVV